MKPIEVDCRCVFADRFGKKNRNNGTVIIVTGFYGPAGCKLPDGSISDKTSGPVWRVDKGIAWARETFNLCSEGYMRRIDDDWGKTTEWDESIWTPHKEPVCGRRNAIEPTSMMDKAFGYAVLLVATGFFFLAVDAVLRAQGL